jgi:iron complex outermembrane receptor protein
LKHVIIENHSQITDVESFVFYKSILAATLVAIPGAAFAQSQTSDGDERAAEWQTDEIIVQAARRNIPAQSLPNTLRLINDAAIKDQLLLSTSLVDVVSSQVPSFSPSRQKLSGVGESFRGRQPLYLIDGVPQSNPLRNGSRDGFTIDGAVIERVEVLYGANAIQGVGATGGIINYTTIRPANGGTGEVRVEAGVTADTDFNGDGYGYRGAVTGLKDFGDFDWVGSVALETRGAFYDGDGRRIGVDGTQGEIQDSQSLNVFTKAGWDIAPDTRLEFMANIFELEGDGDYVQIAGNRDTGVPAISVRGDTEGEIPTNSVNTFSLTFTQSDLFGGKLSAQGFYREFESVFGGGTFDGFFNTGDEAPGEFSFDQSSNISDKTGVKLTYSHSDLPIQGMTVTGGLDVLSDESSQILVQTGRLWVPEVEFVSIAPFLQFDQLLLNDRILVSAGLRQENATLNVADFTTIFSSNSTQVEGGEPDFKERLFNIGGSFEIIDGLIPYASYSQGFTMPDVGRVLRAVNTPNQSVESLVNIDPIVADNTEIGVSFERGGFRANASYFWSESDFGQRLFANAAGIFEVRREPTEISGFELSGEYDFGNDLIIGAGYANLEGQSD